MAPWPAELLSPTPSAVSLTATYTPEDIYYDPRDEPGPSRYVKAVVSQVGFGGVPARSTDGLHCAVAGKDYLKILRITEPGSPASLGGEFARPPSRRSRILGRGPEGATIHDEMTIKLGQNTISTDVAWGHNTNANKIVVTSTSGDILIVDAIKGKLERTIKEHIRSVNGVAFTPHLQDCFATCSQDGYVKLWDMRTSVDGSSVSINHRTETRCIAFSPSHSTRWHAVVALENGGFYKWDYKLKGMGLLDRYHLAHGGAILGMDWVGPNAGPEAQGWLCTGGMDKTVKIWDMSQGLQDQKAAHVLHTAEKVKKVVWRPGHDCEVAIVPQASGVSGRPGADGSEAAGVERIEIWDVRRPWLPKYILEGGEGSVVGMVWAGPDALWATYSNGTLVQHDLRECHRALDGLPRSALAWDPSGAVTWATETVSSSELPYDDVRPSLKPQLLHSGWKEKTPADPDYNAANQTVATVTLPLFDTKGFVELARGYMLAPNPDTGEDVEVRTLGEVCMVNAEVAHQAEYYRASQTWLVLRSLLSPIDTRENHDQEEDERSASPSPVPISQASSVAGHGPTPPLAPFYGARPPARLPDRRTVSTSSVFQYQRPLPTVASQWTTKSSDNSPASENRRGFSTINGAPAPPTNPLTRPTISRRSSNATKVSKSSGGRRTGSGSQDRRNYSKDRGRSASIGSVSRSRASSMAATKQQIGDGALDSSSDDEDAPGMAEPRYRGHSSKSSLASNTLEAPDEEDEHSFRGSSKTPSSRSSTQLGVPPLLYFDDPSDDAGMMADDNYDSSTSSGRDSFKVPAPPSSPVASTLLALDRPKITKQDSRSSIRTAVPSSSRSRALSGAADKSRLTHTSSSGNDTAGKTKPANDPYLTLGSSTDGELDESTRRPSPASSGTERPRHLRAESYTGVSVKPTEEPILEVPSPHIRSHRLNSNSTSPHPSTEHTPLIRDVASLGHGERIPSFGTSRSKFGITATISDHEEDGRGRSMHRKHQTQASVDPVAVMEEEERIRKIGWEAVREAFEYYREMGDVQMCTALATVARGELLSTDESATLDRISSAYVDILTRLRLHTEAAYVRKYGASRDLQASTTVDTVVHAACGRCRKPLMKTSLAPTSSLIAEPLASNASSVTAFSHQRSSSSTRRDEGAKRQSGKHSRHASIVSASGTDQGLGQSSGTGPELAEGGYGFCTNCRRASARCSICRLPVRGIHFFCPICSHGGHHECYRNYYLKRPLMSPTRDDVVSFGVPGSDGWGLSALSKHREPTKTETDDTDSLRSERRDSNPPDPEKVIGPPKEREREGSIVSGLTTSVASLASLGLGGSSGSKPDRGPVREKDRETMSGRERERPRERETARKRLMGHPCAAGCGHFCWMTNDPLERV